jgi:hypothetical protein
MFAGGDGSTLSLDFTTMSSLDSRFTFSRSSTATFINSSGLVRYADHNLVQNSAFVGPNSGTGWVQNGGGTFTNSGTGSITTAVIASNQAYVSRTFVTKQGLRYSASVNVTSISGTINYNQVLAVAGSISADTFYRNGSVVNASTTAQTGLLTIIFTAGAGGTNTFRSGVGASGANQADVTVVFDSVRAVEGENTQPTYFVSPSGSEYQAPRFDYDPSTLAPRGLLIEGSVTNLCERSEDMSNTSHWAVRTNLVTTSWTGFTGPDNSTNAVRLVPNTTSGRHTLEHTAITLVNGTTYTASCWFKADGYTVAAIVATNNQTRRNFVLTGAGSTGSQFGPVSNTATVTAYPNGWYRCTMTWTSSVTTADFWIGVPQNSTTDVVNSWAGNGTDGVQAFGAQLEASSVATSYIPTGTSTVQRAADSCTMTGTNFSSWFAGVTSGYSVLWSCSPQSRQAGSFPPMICLRGPSDSGSRSYYYNDGTYNTAHRTSNGTTASESFGPNSLTYGVARKFAISVTNGSQLVSSNGATANSNTQAITSFNQTTLGFGNDADTTPGSLTGRQHFQSFKFWPYPQTQAALNALTA